MSRFQLEKAGKDEVTAATIQQELGGQWSGKKRKQWMMKSAGSAKTAGGYETGSSTTDPKDAMLVPPSKPLLILSLRPKAGFGCIPSSYIIAHGLRALFLQIGVSMSSLFSGTDLIS